MDGGEEEHLPGRQYILKLATSSVPAQITALKHKVDVDVPANNGTRPKKADLMNSDLAKAVAYSGLDQKNVGLRSNRVSPFYVERDFADPTRVGRRKARAAALIHLGEDRIRQPELHVELVKVVGDIRIVESIHDGDGLSATVTLHRAIGKENLIESVGVSNLTRIES